MEMKANSQIRTETEPTTLSKVQSDEYRKKVEAVLKNCHPTDNQRLWLVGFLNYAGYTGGEIMEIIKLKCAWTDYNEQITGKRIEYMLNRGNCRGHPPQRVEAVQKENVQRTCSPPPQRGLYPPQSLDKMVSKSADECASYSCRTYVAARFCQISCEQCEDCKCVEALGFINELYMSNMQRADS